MFVRSAGFESGFMPIVVVMFVLLALLGVAVFLTRAGTKPYLGCLASIAILVFLMDVPRKLKSPDWDQAPVDTIIIWILNLSGPAVIGLMALAMSLMVIGADPVGKLFGSKR